MGVDIETYRGRIGTFKFAVGTDVVTVECIINFSHGLKSVCAVAFIGLLLLMAGIEPNPGPRISDGNQNLGLCTTIEVSGIPKDVDEKYLTLVFENPSKQGGGKVKSVQLDPQERTALIDFEDPNAVQLVLQKTPIKIADSEVVVKAVTKAQPCTVEVEGFAMMNSIEEFLKYYFEDEESSGGDTVVGIKLVDKGRALVTFESEEVAKRVVGKEAHTLTQSVTVSLFNKTDSSWKQFVSETSAKSPKEITETQSLDDFPRPIEPVPIGPVPTEPLHTESVPMEQIPTEPLLTESVPMEQIPTEPVLTEPALSEPMRTEPMLTEPISIEPMPTETMSADQMPTKPIPTELSPTESVPTNPIHTETLLTESVPIEQIPTEPVPTELSFPEPIPTTPTPTKPVLIQPIFTQPVLTKQEPKEAPPTDQMPSELITAEQVTTEQIPVEQVTTEPAHAGKVTTEPTPTAQIPSEAKAAEQVTSEPLSTEKTTAEQQHSNVTEPNNRSQIDTVTNERVPTKQSLTEPVSTVPGTKDKTAKGNSTEQPFKDEIQCSLEDTDGEDITIHHMLQKLGLVDKYPERIRIEDVTAVSLKRGNQKTKEISEVPWILLRQIIGIQSQARDNTTSVIETEANDETVAVDKDMFDIFYETSASDELSPLDVFNLTIECCDKILKQLLFKKLYLCKIAVPFVYIDRLSLKSKISVWPLRSLIVLNKPPSQMEPKSNEFEILELPVNTVTFAHFGRTQFSKSKLVNDLMSDQIHDTFFHEDCPSGSVHRLFSKGIIEFFCLPAIGDQIDKFNEAVSFFNMRGEIETDFNDNVITFISQLSDTLVLVIDIRVLEANISSLSKILLNFSRVVLVLDGHLDAKDAQMLKRYTEQSPSPLTLVRTYKRKKKKNVKEIEANVRDAIVSVLSETAIVSIETRLRAISTTLEIDEDEEQCATGKLVANRIFKAMEHTGDRYKRKQLVTPVNHIHSQNLGASVKRLYRLKNVEETEQVENEIKSVSIKQTESISDPMKLFINAITDNIQKYSLLQYIFGWLNFFLEKEKRLILPKLIEENSSCWETLETLKRQQSSKDSDEKMEKQIKLTDASQRRIEDASLGIEHLFRELGHIYEALMTLDKTIFPAKFQLPSENSVIEAVAELVVKGQPFELVDGDNFYMPKRWVNAVLVKVSDKLHQRKVLALSVLGLQSSGKSTLLNALFGSQFPVKSGRCTRGIHIQLLPIAKSNLSRFPIEFVLIIDTEGLRAPEISPNRANHDNELSTVITGLGDITLLNIMGENTSEIRDILQVVVHAFLRLKLVNKALDIGKSFYLLHQNVVDISAANNMRTGLQVLLETMDTVTKEAAGAEGIKEIASFNQIIEFDMKSNVWYLPNFWQGNPPMARVNSGYSERLYNNKCNLFDTALAKCNKSYQTLEDIALRMQDLWKGVLTEDFVYSFRNSLEIKAYVILEEMLKDNLIKLENEVDKIRITVSQTEFSKCQEQNHLQNAFDKVVNKLQETLAEKESMVKETMAKFFDNNEYTDTTIQWKEFTFNRIRLYCNELEVSMKLETMRMRERAVIDIMTAENSKQHEKELYERSLHVAKETKGKILSDEEINIKFEETWKNVLREIVNVGVLCRTQVSVKDSINKCLFDVIFTTEKMILKTELEKRGIFQHETEHPEMETYFVNVGHLKGSFENTGIVTEDISFRIDNKDSEERRLIIIKEKIDYLFEALDLYITRCCQGSMEITQTDVKNVLVKTKHEVDLIQKRNAEFTLKTTAVVKLFIHVSFYVQVKFDEHNLNYQKSHGVEARLQTYKMQVKEHFIGFIRDRKAEETAAKGICIIIDTVLREKIKERLPVAVKAALLNSLTHLKFHLMLEMLEDMTNNDDFDSFIEYINHPKLFAEKWITRKSETLLFDSESKKYSELAAEIVAEFYDELKESVKLSAQVLEFETGLSTEKWLECFTTKFSKYNFQLSSFSDIHKQLEKIEDMNNFTTALLDQIKASQGNLNREFQEQTSTSVKWSGMNPYADLIQKAWGCKEQCAFCGEPCAKDSNHEGAKHYSLQHRISCCAGVREGGTNEASITSCNYDVQSDQTHHCNVFNFLCNPTKKVNCDMKHHSYRDYRTYLPDWDIEPNSNMQDCAKFWLWFVATYKNKLAHHYRYRVSNVPNSWSDITKAEALENLRRIYTGSN